MNIKINNLNVNELELDNPSSSLLTNNKKLEFKSQGKEQKFFKEVFPKILSDNQKSKKNHEHTVSRVEQKVKGISLSVHRYNKYMVNYKNLLKYPSNNYYSTARIKNYISYNMIKNTNLNKKKNFYCTLNDFGKSNHIMTYSLDTTKNNTISGHNGGNKIILIPKRVISQRHNKIMNKNDNEINDEEMFKYFIEGTFLSEPDKIKDLKINEKKLHPYMLNKNDFDFYEQYLENLNKNENFTDDKMKEFYFTLCNNSRLKFILGLKSLCLYFQEIYISNINIKANSANDNTKNITEGKNFKEKEKKKNIQRIYLPFKYMPLFFLLNYSSFKSFISEIIFFDIESNKFKIIINDKLEQIIKKYSDYVQNKINTFTSENNTSVFNDIIYYKNEFQFNYIFPWIIYDNRFVNTKVKFYKLKIIYPTITFQPEDYGIKFQKFSSKWLIFELIKNNFIFWDRYLLYVLFMNKKFRNTISYIINKKRNHISYEYNIKTIGQIINDKVSKKNNFDIFVTDILNSKNHFYYFAPFKASISSRKHSKYNLNDVICLKLNDSRTIYKLSKYFGLIATFNKCMFYNKLTKKYYFAFKLLQDITQDYISLLKNDNTHNKFVENKKYKQVFNYNGKEYHLIIRECLLCEKIINMYNFSELKYYKIPNDLLSYVLENEIYNDDLYNILTNKSSTILNIEEIEEYREFFLKKNTLADSSSSLTKTGKEKTRKKGKNLSNFSLTKVEKSDTKIEKIKGEQYSVIQLKETNNEKVEPFGLSKKNSKNNTISRKLSELNKNAEPLREVYKKQFLDTDCKKKDNNGNIKDKSKNNNNTNIINDNDLNKNNIENIHKNSEYGDIENKIKYINNVSNKRQLELMRIKRGVNNGGFNNDFERLKFNLKTINNNNI